MADDDALDEAGVLEQAMEAQHAGDHDRAIELCTLLIEADDGWAQPHYFRGASRLAREHFEEALADLGRAIDLEPEIPAFAYHDRGRALAGLGRHEEALADYEHALRLQPGKATTYHRMAFTLYQLGRLDDAVAAYGEAILLAPDWAEFLFDRGAVYLARGQLDEAVADFTRAIELEPDALHYFSRGTAHLRQGDHARALADLNEAIACDPADARAWYARGYVHYLTRRCEQAEADLDRAVELDPSLEAWPYEGRWLDEQRGRVGAYLRAEGVSGTTVPGEPAWDLAPYLALWRVEGQGGGLWVIVGDCPSDRLPEAGAVDARAALDAFGRRWLRAAEDALAGREDPEMRLGPPERWPELAPLLRARAELLLEYAANDDIWQRDE